MCHWVRSLLVLAMLSGAAVMPASSTAGDVPRAIQQVIGSQMEAFKADDGERAFSFAAPSIRQIFRNSESFMAMVREGYAPVYRPAEVEFRDLTTSGDNVIQRVFIRGANGEAVIATYTLRQMADGSWKISACQIEKLPELAA